MAEGDNDGDAPDDSQKTEEPTPRKLEEARKKGQVANSREVTTWLMLFTGTMILATSGPIFENYIKLLEDYIANADQLPGSPAGLGLVLTDAVTASFKIIAMPLLALVFMAIMGPLLQIGPLFSPDSIKPSLSKISIIKGFGRLFSQKSLVEFLKGIFKLVVVGFVSAIIIYPYLPALEHLITEPLPMVMDDLLGMTIHLMIGILIVLFLIAGADLIYQRFSFYQQLRMTKQEVKDEYRQSEGDPVVRGKLRQLRAEKARQRMMQAVPKADVVITNPTHFAVALQYDPEKMDAPKLLAKGADDIAMRIRELAKENKIEIVENPPLARAIYDTVDIDATIPQDLYKAVAEVISYVFKKTGKLKQKPT